MEKTCFVTDVHQDVWTFSLDLTSSMDKMERGAVINIKQKHHLKNHPTKKKKKRKSLGHLYNIDQMWQLHIAFDYTHLHPAADK